MNFSIYTQTFVIRPDGSVNTIFIEEGIDFEEQLRRSISKIKEKMQKERCKNEGE